MALNPSSGCPEGAPFVNSRKVPLRGDRYAVTQPALARNIPAHRPLRLRSQRNAAGLGRNLAARGKSLAGVACGFGSGSSLSKLRVFHSILVVSPPRSRAKSAARYRAGLSPRAAREKRQLRK